MVLDARDVAKLVDPIRKRAQLVITRAVLRLVGDDRGIQSCQVEALAGDVRDDAERFQNYGFTSVPFAGAECVAAAVGGTASHSIVVVIDDRRYRLKSLKEGEVAIYDDQGQVVHLMRDQVKVFTEKPINIEGADITVTSNGDTTVNVTGNVAVASQGNATVTSVALARVEGAQVQIHGMTSLKLDAGGYGETWTAGGRQTWTQGTSTTNMGAPSPPEHP